MKPVVPEGLRERKRLSVVAVESTAIVVVDQLVKALVRQNLQAGAPIDVFHNVLSWNLTRNSGAAFGLFPTGGAFFVAVAVSVVVVILANHSRLSRAPWPTRSAVALIAGGAMGNALDRIRLGYVTDFVDLHWWPVFNIADSAIVLGVGLLLVQTVLARSESPEHE